MEIPKEASQYKGIASEGRKGAPRLDREIFCEAAVRNGDLETLKWAVEKGYPWDKDTLALDAAHFGHLEILQWAITQGCPLVMEICAVAAGGGHLEVLKWAREQGCPGNDAICSFAAGEGRLEVLKWARAQNPPCPWDHWTYDMAKDSGRPEVLQWVIDNGCPTHASLEFDPDIISAFLG